MSLAVTVLWDYSGEQRLASESGMAVTMYVKGVLKCLTGNTGYMSQVYTMASTPDQQRIVSMVPLTRSCVWILRVKLEKLESCQRVSEMPTQGRVGCTNESRRCRNTAVRIVFKLMQGALGWPLGEFDLHNSSLLVGKAP